MRLDRKYALVMLLFVTLIVPLVSAETSFYIPQNTNHSIKFSCSLDGGFCDSGVACNLSIEYPNSTILLDNVAATNLNNGFFNYTLTQNETSIKGEHTAVAYCHTSTNSLNDTSNFIYEVNPSGIRSSEQRTDSLTMAIWLMAGLGVLFFIGFLISALKLPIRLTFLLFAFIFFLISINLTTTVLKDEVVNTSLETFFDGISAISWYVYWFFGAFVAILWIFTFFNMWWLKKNQEHARRFGGSFEPMGRP